MLSGCTTLVDLANKLDPSTKTFTVPYIEPDVQTNSRIRVISDTTVKILPNRSCVDWNAPGAGMVSAHSFALGNDKTHNDKVIGIPRAGEIKNSSEVYIKPNEPLVLVYGHKTSCLIEASFIPEENTDYQILSDTSSGRCTMELSKVTVDKATNIIIYTPLKLNNAYPCKE